MIALIKLAKARVFDETLWCAESPANRIKYSYRETADWKKLGRGVTTFPCCPHCGSRVGADNNDFRRGDFCDAACTLAFCLHYRLGVKEIAEAIRREIAASKVGVSGEGI
jgi:hypothetical protein